jgi:hypothetical protein
VERKRVRGWLGAARDLVASVVEQGLNLPDAAAFIRGDLRYEPLTSAQPPVATVTLAGIYGAQGHYDRAVTMLEEVLEKEPDHRAAEESLTRLRRDRDRDQKNRPKTTSPAETTADAATDEEASEPEWEPPSDAAVTLPPAAATASADEDPAASVSADEDPMDRAPTLPPIGRASTLDEDPSDRASTLPPAAHPSPPTDDDASDRAETLPPGARPDSDDELDRAETLRPRATNGSGSDGTGDYAAILVRATPTKAVVYFETPAPNGHASNLSVQAVEWQPGVRGALRVAHEVSVAGQSGTAVIDRLAAGSVVRAVLGMRRGDVFVRLAVACEVRLSAGAPEVVWTPRKRVPDAAVAARSAPALRPFVA